MIIVLIVFIAINAYLFHEEEWQALPGRTVMHVMIYSIIRTGFLSVYS